MNSSTAVSHQDDLPAFLEEGKHIVETARENNVTLRLMGATAVALHCPKFMNMFSTFERKLTDLDLMGYSKELKQTRAVLEKLGYSLKKLDYEVAISAYGERSIFRNNSTDRHVDLFFDKLAMCHTINFRNRLKIDYPTISPSDLLLEKTQIVKVNEKDIKDVVILLREHNIGHNENDTINSDYISELLSDDWGFYYTVTENIRKISGMLSGLEVLNAEDVANVKPKLDELLSDIEKRPKSMKWKMRAKIGSSKKWYNDVEEVVR